MTAIFLNPINLLAILIAIFLLVFLIVWLMRKGTFATLLKKSFKYELFLIKLPPEESPKEKQQSLKEKISMAEQFITILTNFKKPVVLEIALPEIGEEIAYYVAVPKEFEESFKKHLLSFYPKAYFEKTKDYNIFNSRGVTMGAYLKQAENWMLPIKTYNELEADPINSILNAFKLQKEGEGIAMQIIFSSAPKSLKKQITQVIKDLKEGQSLKDALGEDTFKNALKTFTSSFSTSSNEKKEEPKPKTIDENSIKLLEAKISKLLCTVNVRLFVSTATKERTEETFNTLLAAFDQFDVPLRNRFKAIKPKNLNKFVFNYAFRLFDPKEEIYLNTEELASFWHFPMTVENAPQAKRVKSREAPPPTELPEEGIIIGESIYQNQKRIVRILPNDRRRHLYTVGQTGVGKSVFLTNMAVQDIQEGRGVCIIDPHGDLIESILGLVPKERFEDVVVFDPSDLERPIGLNTLETDPNKPEQKTFVINEWLDIFDKLYNMSEVGGPMFENYLRNAMGLLMSDVEEIPTVIDIPRIFSNRDYLKKKLAKCPDPLIIEFWEKQALQVSKGQDLSLENVTPYITSKFTSFISNDYMRPIIAQKKSTINFRKIMDEQKILLVNLAKGKIGDLNSSLLGLMIVGKLLMAAFSRVELPEEERKDFYLYIDEFQNFTTPSITTILSEARKYRLDLIISHQFIAQLQDKIREAIFGNVGNMVVFRVGVKDAEFLVKQFEPVFNENDMINLDNFVAIAKLLVKNIPTRSFTMKTLPPPQGNSEIAKLLKEYSRLTYGTPRGLIEQEIREKYQKESEDLLEME
ncbi:MAG TPA: TraM recognition domain-containing protein [Candidatus Paceibacterota bacterium]|nr:TraM recognition domain-containing protein [Candidatus Paceibacterota bacterium]